MPADLFLLVSGALLIASRKMRVINFPYGPVIFPWLFQHKFPTYFQISLTCYCLVELRLTSDLCLIRVILMLFRPYHKGHVNIFGIQLVYLKNMFLMYIKITFVSTSRIHLKMMRLLSYYSM